MDADYATLGKFYETDLAVGRGRYSPPICTTVRKRRIVSPPRGVHIPSATDRDLIKSA